MSRALHEPLHRTHVIFALLIAIAETRAATTCAAGSYLSASNTCTPCDAGFYCAADSTAADLSCADPGSGDFGSGASSCSIQPCPQYTSSAPGSATLDDCMRTSANIVASLDGTDLFGTDIPSPTFVDACSISRPTVLSSPGLSASRRRCSRRPAWVQLSVSASLQIVLNVSKAVELGMVEGHHWRLAIYLEGAAEPETFTVDEGDASHPPGLNCSAGASYAPIDWHVAGETAYALHARSAERLHVRIAVELLHGRWTDSFDAAFAGRGALAAVDHDTACVTDRPMSAGLLAVLLTAAALLVLVIVYLLLRKVGCCRQLRAKETRDAETRPKGTQVV